MNERVRIEFGDDYYVVFYSGRRGNEVEIAYGSKDTDFKDHAQNFYELAACLNAHVNMEKT